MTPEVSFSKVIKEILRQKYQQSRLKRKDKAMKANNYTKLKTIIEVMGKYGIKPISKVKRSDFMEDMGFDRVFLDGLIFDVEDALHLELTEEMAHSLRSPEELIRHMIQHQN